MFKEMFFAVTLTLIFSAGVGVLFVSTLAELLDIFLSKNPDSEATPPSLQKRG